MRRHFQRFPEDWLLVGGFAFAFVVAAIEVFG